ncbi:MAG: hypothetical protein IK083_02710, partial [Abditibacteriota bacterium]|nr:hypothetical protein [Abditibacteriota bacterium]
MLLLVMAAAVLSPALCAAAAQLTRDGKALSVIVCPAGSTLPEQNAARELSSYIEKISGARLPVEEA